MWNPAYLRGEGGPRKPLPLRGEGAVFLELLLLGGEGAVVLELLLLGWGRGGGGSVVVPDTRAGGSVIIDLCFSVTTMM